jgi:hypothetical protein
MVFCFIIDIIFACHGAPWFIVASRLVRALAAIGRG